MFKKIIAVVLLCVVVGGILSACQEDKRITGLQAKLMALDDLGITEDQAEVHVHTGEKDGQPCYYVYVTYGGQNLQYIIRESDGQILFKGAGSHTH